MRTRQILAWTSTILGAMLILLGLMSVFSLEQAQTRNQFLGLICMIVGGIGLGYMLFTRGTDYFLTGQHIFNIMNKSATDLAKVLAIQKKKTETDININRILLPDMKRRLEDHNRYIKTLEELRELVLLDSPKLEEIIVYHYECAGKLQEIIERIERLNENDGDIRGEMIDDK